MRPAALLACSLLFLGPTALGQWIAPEGKIINTRTILWSDFLGKPDRDEDPEAAAAVRPVIYMSYEDEEDLVDNKVKFRFMVKCAFQSAAWVRPGLEKGFMDYALIHEQHHYDIALLYANLLQIELDKRVFDRNRYREEVEGLYDSMMKKENKTQDKYDGEGEHGRIKETQHLWDMRIKKCLENCTDEYYASPLDVVKTVAAMGQTVKRAPHEAARQFALRCRPIYTEMPDELGSKIVETKEWTAENAVIAFYTQKVAPAPDDPSPAKDSWRVFGYAFMPMGNNTYKRVLIDTFYNQENTPEVSAVFFANADTADKANELVIVTKTAQKNQQGTGKLYNTRIYDNTLTKTFPNRLRKLPDVAAKVEGGIDGVQDGRPRIAKFKTEKDIRDELKKLGY